MGSDRARLGTDQGVHGIAHERYRRVDLAREAGRGVSGAGVKDQGVENGRTRVWRGRGRNDDGFIVADATRVQR